MGLVLALFSVLIATAFAQTEQEVKTLLLTYEKSQNTLDATLCQSVFDVNATIHLPMGEAPIVGRKNIYTAFLSFFASLNSLREVLQTPILVHKTGAGYSKTLFAVYKETGCDVILPAVQWFVINNSTKLIAEMGVVYNVTDFQTQAGACIMH